MSTTLWAGLALADRYLGATISTPSSARASPRPARRGLLDSNTIGAELGFSVK